MGRNCETRKAVLYYQPVLGVVVSILSERLSMFPSLKSIGPLLEFYG